MLVKERFKNKGLFNILDDYYNLPFNKTVTIEDKQFIVEITKEMLDIVYINNCGCRVINEQYENLEDEKLANILTNMFYSKWCNTFNLLYTEHIKNMLNSDTTTIETDNVDNKKTEVNNTTDNKISAYNDVKMVEDTENTNVINSDINNKSNLKTTILKTRSDNYKNVKSFIINDLNVNICDIIYNDVNNLITEIIYN